MRTLLWTLIVCVLCAMPALSVTRRPASVTDRCPPGMQPGKRCSQYGLCIPGYRCDNGWCCRNTCPAGSLTGPECDRNRPCKYGYTCRRGNCCSNQCPSSNMIKGSFCNVNQACQPNYKCFKGICCRWNTCPAGSLTGPECDRNRPCKYGYTCRRGNCCSNQCPSPRMIKGSFCNVNQPCQPNYKCFKGICCRWANIHFGYCPRVRPPPYMPVCPPNLAEIFLQCTSDRDCTRFEKCCKTDCGLMRCVTALQNPPDEN